MDVHDQMITWLMAEGLTSTVRFRWWISSTLSVAIAGPLVASFVLLPWILLAGSPHSFDIPSYVIAFLFLAVPVGYVFGVVPALLAGATYSATLIALPPLRARPLGRLALGAACGAFWAGLWFPPLTANSSGVYVLVAALTMALLALRKPENNERWIYLLARGCRS